MSQSAPSTQPTCKVSHLDVQLTPDAVIYNGVRTAALFVVREVLAWTVFFGVLALITM